MTGYSDTCDNQPPINQPEQEAATFRGGSNTAARSCNWLNTYLVHPFTIRLNKPNSVQTWVPSTPRALVLVVCLLVPYSGDQWEKDPLTSVVSVVVPYIDDQWEKDPLISVISG